MCHDYTADHMTKGQPANARYGCAARDLSRVRPAWRTTYRVKVPLTTCQEEGLVKDNGVAARRGRKEVWNKTRTLRTETAYEAQALDEAARHVNVQSLNGRRRCKCGG